MEEEERRSDLQSFQETAEQQSSSNLKVAVNLNDQFQQQRDMKKRQRLHQFNIVPESSLGEKGMDNSDQCVSSREVDVDVDVDSRADTTETSTKGKSMLLKKWFIGLVLSSIMHNESKRRKNLTALPLVYHQDTERNHRLNSLMSAVFLRKYRPSLFLGTRSMMNSSMAYMKPGPVAHNRMREHMHMSRDGATIALDWEGPREKSHMNNDYLLGKTGPITENIVLILHGVNTDSSFGYIRSIMNSCTNNKWIAVGMNARSSGNINMTTPRLMNSAYTNDIRNVVEVLSSRQSPNAKLFLVGFSMGANTLVKYLGESALAGNDCLPPNVTGAISFANPMKINPRNLKAPWNQILTMGAKQQMRQHEKTTSQMTCHHYQNAIQKASSLLHSSSLADISSHIAPYMIRNSNQYPFHNSIGYESSEEYWNEASSLNYISHVSIPLLVCFANDDGIAETTIAAMNTCLSNPNVIIARTPCGGHMGWHCSNRLNPFGSWNFKSSKDVDKSWADRVAVLFISAVLRTEEDATSSNHLNEWKDRSRKDVSYLARDLSSRLDAKL
jgi:hypothetical protein